MAIPLGHRPHPLQNITRRDAPCGRPWRVLRFARWSAATFRVRRALAARRRLRACVLLGPLGCLSRFHLRRVTRGDGLASRARARPQAAARSAAEGPGEDVGEAEPLIPLERPKPLVWGAVEGSEAPRRLHP